MAYERDNIRHLEAYTPGEQPQPGQNQTIIKLNTNENPYPPAPEVLEAIRGVGADSLRRYPQPQAMPCREAIAQAHGLSPDQVIVTNGGDELLRLAVTVFCHPRSGQAPPTANGGVGVGHPSYSLYPVLAGIHDTPLTEIALGDDFALPPDFADRLNTAGCRLAMVVNPHAPSGRLEPLERLRALAHRFKGVLLIDEAYVDFAQHDALGLLATGEALDNVLILRTLSKGYSLAGLRLGYGLGHPGLIQALDKARDSYNLNALSQAAAIAALQHRDHAAATWRAVIDQRGRLANELSQRGYRVYPSASNFLLTQPPYDARGAYESLKANGVLVRYFDQQPLRDKLRITVGTPEENDALLVAIDQLATGPGSA